MGIHPPLTLISRSRRPPFYLIPYDGSGYKWVMDKIRDYFLSTRPQFLPASIIPVALGASVAYSATERFNLFFFILSLCAAILYHSGMNVLNDYFDHVNGTDDINKTALTPFTGGSRFIQRGLLSPRETLALGAVLVCSGSAAGLYLASETSGLLLLIGAIGLFSGFFYSAPPFFLAGRGLGEFTVGLNFGVLTVLGSYLVQTGTVTNEAFFYSLPVSFLITALLYVNEFPDYEADRIAGKRTLVVRMGPQKGRWGLVFIVAGAYLSIVAGAALGILHNTSLIALLSIFFVLPGVKGLIKNYSGGDALIPSIKSIILAHLSSGILLIISNFL